MSWIPSFGQTGEQSPDTVRCYGITELRYIAIALVEGQACDTLLANANAKLANRDSLISEKNLEITKISSQIVLKDKIILLKEEELRQVNLYLAKEKTRHRWTKLGWGATTVVLSGALFYFMLN